MTLRERRTNVGRCTATALGIDIPAILLGRATDVIEKGIDLVRCMSPFLADSVAKVGYGGWMPVRWGAATRRPVPGKLKDYVEARKPRHRLELS
jgi:hypothetical protein